MLKRLWLILLGVLLSVSGGCNQPKQAGTPEPRVGRLVIDLNGTWEIAEGGMDSVPGSFERKVPVPGLVDMTEPAFEEVGKKSPRRQAFWYRRTFAVDSLVGEHLPCFTPALLDVKPLLKGDKQQNELIVRVGADRESLPEGMPTGWDFEKYLYIPGIYDSVELILTDPPYIARVQTVPDIEQRKVKIVAEIDNVDDRELFDLHFRLREARTGRSIESGAVGITSVAGQYKVPVTFEIPIEKYHLWSPENPFLYMLELFTEGDDTRTRFGMR